MRVVVSAAKGKVEGVVQQEGQIAADLRIEPQPVLVGAGAEETGFDHHVRLIAGVGVAGREALGVPSAEVIRYGAGRIRHEALVSGVQYGRVTAKQDDMRTRTAA